MTITEEEQAKKHTIVSHLLHAGTNLNVCRLCLNATSEVSTVQDVYEFKRAEFCGTVTVAEMIQLFSGVQMADHSQFPNAICESCTSSTVNSFFFTKLCQNSDKLWNSILDALHHNITINEAIEQKNPKTVYLILSKTEATILEDVATPKSKQEAVQRLNELKMGGKGKFNKREVKKKPPTTNKVSPSGKAKVTKVDIKLEGISYDEDSDHSYLNATLNNTIHTKVYHFCKLCPKKYRSRSILKQHFKKEHRTKNTLRKYKCLLCEKVFDCKRTLYKHGYVHRETKSSYSCMKCTKIFSYPSSLKKHMKLIHGDKKYKCPECPKNFVREFMLKGHMKDVHSGYQYVCSDCGRSFKTKSSLRFHEESHRQKLCKNCGKRYKCKKSYQDHEKLCSKGNVPTNLNITKVLPVDNYDGVQQYICDHCGKIFFRKQSLLIHVKTLHLHAKMFDCDKCGKKFRTKGQVKCHDIVHTRERNEKCDICGRYFITKYALIYHMRLHTGERPFHCDLCEEKFISSSRLQSHKRTKHWGPSEECTVCFSKFFTKYALRVHMKRHFNPTSKLFCKANIDNISRDLVEN